MTHFCLPTSEHARLSTTLLLILLAVAPMRAADLKVTDIKAAHRHSQTFITWHDVAKGEASANYRYSLYRSEQPITAKNLKQAELCYHGVLNNSARLYGSAFNRKDRLDTTKPYAIIQEGGKPLPPWSGLAVVTIKKPGKMYYAVVATDLNLKPVSAIVPGQSATTEAVVEKPGDIQPIKLYDSRERKSYVAQTSITGKKGLSLRLRLGGSDARGGGASAWGDYYLFFGNSTMGYRDGLAGVFSVQENRHKDGNQLLLVVRDAVEHPSGKRAMETYWYGYACVPQGASHTEPRVYPYTENQLQWITRWAAKRYNADPERIVVGGGSSGAVGSFNFGLRRPELFAAVYPNRGRVRKVPAIFLGKKNARGSRLFMADGKTEYIDQANGPRFVTEHHADLPFVGWCCGRRDGYATWQENIDMVKAMTAAHHGFAFSWNNGDHSSGSRSMAPIVKYYPAHLFARNRSYPAFGNSSIDQKMGNGDPKDGDLEGGINLGFRWSDVIDEEKKWSAQLENDLATSGMTVDVTPRRCIKFKARPGEHLTWATSDGRSGKLMADKHGLVTVTGVRLKTGNKLTLTIKH